MMTGWEVQEMEENARNRQWEEMWMSEEESDARDKAAQDIGYAISSLDEAIEWLDQSAEDMEKYPEYDRIKSFEYDLLELITNISKMKWDIEKR